MTAFFSEECLFCWIIKLYTAGSDSMFYAMAGFIRTKCRII